MKEWTTKRNKTTTLKKFREHFLYPQTKIIDTYRKGEWKRKRSIKLRAKASKNRSNR